MHEELEAQRLEAEIEKLKAETESFRRPSAIQRYVAYAAVVGALSGLAAVLQVGLQLRTLTYDQMQKRYEMENQTLDARAAAESAKRDEATARSMLAAEQKNYSLAATQLADAVAKKNAAEQEETAYRSALAASAGQRQILAARVAGAPVQGQRGIVQIFLRQGSSAGERCAAILTQAGFTVGGVEQATHGPQNDEVKYFWPSDLGLATEVGKLASTCDLKVPSFNYILITGDPSSANSPRKYFELWAGTTR